MHDLLTGKTVHLDVHGNIASSPLGPTSTFVLVPGTA
jgi:hypothetical protein